MDLTGTMDITFNDNFKDLPSELKYCILPYIDIRKFVSYNDPTIDPFIDAYIKHYIDEHLFTDASMFEFFMNAHQNSHYARYGKTIKEKIYKMATVWAKDFMEQCELLNEEPVDNPLVGVCFNIKYNWSSKLYDVFMNNPKPIKTSIEFFQNPHNHFTIIKESIDRIYSNAIKSKFLRSDIVISEMVDSICHFMTRAGLGISQIHSIELIKLYRPSTIYYSDDNADGEIIKKYY